MCTLQAGSVDFVDTGEVSFILCPCLESVCSHVCMHADRKRVDGWGTGASRWRVLTIEGRCTVPALSSVFSHASLRGKYTINSPFIMQHLFTFP